MTGANRCVFRGQLHIPKGIQIFRQSSLLLRFRDALTFWFLPYEVSHCEQTRFTWIRTGPRSAWILLRAVLSRTNITSVHNLSNRSRYTRELFVVLIVPLERDHVLCFRMLPTRCERKGLPTIVQWKGRKIETFFMFAEVPNIPLKILEGIYTENCTCEFRKR